MELDRDSPLVLDATPNVVRVGQRRGTLTPALGFMDSALLLVPSRDAKLYLIQIKSNVIVEDVASSTIIASWFLEHELQVELAEWPAIPPESLRAKLERIRTGIKDRRRGWDWESGLADLVFPFGRIPGEPVPPPKEFEKSERK